MKKLILLTLPLIAVGCSTASNKSALKQSTANKKVTKVAKKEQAKRGIICKNEKPTGSRIAKRTCWTKAEYKAKQERDKELLRRARDTIQGSDMTNGPAGG